MATKLEAMQCDQLKPLGVMLLNQCVFWGGRTVQLLKDIPLAVPATSIAAAITGWYIKTSEDSGCRLYRALSFGAAGAIAGFSGVGLLNLYRFHVKG